MADVVQHVFILGGGQEDIALDITTREGHTSELEVTSEPLETGVVASDHAFMRQRELEIEGEISDTWLYGFDQRTGLALPDRFYSSKASRSASAWEILLGLQETAEPISVQTGLRLYENMMLVGLNTDQDPSTANGLPVKLRFRQITRKSTQTVTYPPRAPSKPHRQASKKVEGGEKKTAAITDPQKARTPLKQLLAGGNSSVADAFSALIH